MSAANNKATASAPRTPNSLEVPTLAASPRGYGEKAHSADSSQVPNPSPSRSDDARYRPAHTANRLIFASLA
jgi:hypothetical protein